MREYQNTVTSTVVVIRRSRPEGRVHREKLRALLLPRIQEGSVLPRQAWIGRVLGIHPAEGGRHLHRMLAEAGITTVCRGKPKRTVVVSVPASEQGRAA